MDDKTILVPIRYYQLLAALARWRLDYLDGKPDRTDEETAELAAFVRWEQWHSAADERGLTRL